MVTKLIDRSGHRIIPPMPYIKANYLASSCMISYALGMCHKLRQLFSSTIETHHSSLLDYRHGAN